MDTKRTKTRRAALTGQPASLANDALGEPASTALRYHRLSADKGADEKQDNRTRRMSEKRGATILATFSDDETTAWYDPVVDDEPEPRPGFDKLLAAIAELRPTYVVCLRPSRLTRNVDDFARFRRVAARARVVVVTERREYDMTDPADRSALMRACDEDDAYVSSISEGLSSALADRRDLGQPRFGGVRPYGFELDRVTPKPDEAACIRWLAERVLAGDRLAALADELNERGVLTPLQATLNPARADERKRDVSESRWTYSTIQSLLRRESTCGWLAHEGEMVREFAAVASGEVEPILPRELWARVNKVLDDYRPAAPRPNAGSFFLVGLLACAAPRASRANGNAPTTCGGRMHGTTEVQPNGRIVRKYRCERGCTTVPADDRGEGDKRVLGIESVARGVMLDLGSDERHMHAIAEAAEARSQEWRALHDELTELERERREWATARDANGKRLAYPVVAPRLAEIDADLRAVEAKLDKLDPPADNLDKLKARARANLARAWEVATPDKRRAMLASVVGGICIAPTGRGRRTPPAERVAELIERR